MLAKPLSMACQHTFSTGERDALGCKEEGKGVSCLCTGTSSTLLLPLGPEGGQETVGTDMKPLLVQTAHLASCAHTKAVLSAAAAGGKLSLPTSPGPGHRRLWVLCSSTSCFWQCCKTGTGKAVWVALSAHLEALANSQLTLLSEKNAEIWVSLQACQC